MHALRIAHQGEEFLRTGRITLPVAEPERSRLMQVRRGEIPPSEVLDRLRDSSAALERAMLSGDVAEEPDRAVVDAFLIDAYQGAWTDRGRG